VNPTLNAKILDNMSVANRFRQSITKALSLTDINDDDRLDDSQSNHHNNTTNPKYTSESIITKSVNLFSKFASSSNSNVNSSVGDRRQKTLLVVDGNKEHDW